MKEPQSYLPPVSQPWGRWVVSTVKQLIADANIFRTETRNNLKQLNIAALVPFRGQLSRQSQGSVTITTQGVYVPIPLTTTLDSAISFNMSKGLNSPFGLRNDTERGYMVRVFSAIDARAGNNKILGIKLVKYLADGTTVVYDETECRAFTASGGEEAKLVTSWIVRLDPGEEIATWIANHSDTVNIDFRRGKMIANSVI